MLFGGPTRRVFTDDAVAVIADEPPGAGRLDALRRGLIGPRLLVIGLYGNDDKGADEEGDDDFGQRAIAEGGTRGGGHRHTRRVGCGWDREGTDNLRRGYVEEEVTRRE